MGGESASLMYIQHVNMAMLLVRIQPTLAAVIIKKMFVDPSATAFIVFITVDHIFLLLSCHLQGLVSFCLVQGGCASVGLTTRPAQACHY